MTEEGTSGIRSVHGGVLGVRDFRAVFSVVHSGLDVHRPGPPRRRHAARRRHRGRGGSKGAKSQGRVCQVVVNRKDAKPQRRKGRKEGGVEGSRMKVEEPRMTRMDADNIRCRIRTTVPVSGNRQTTPTNLRRRRIRELCSLSFIRWSCPDQVLFRSVWHLKNILFPIRAHPCNLRSFFLPPSLCVSAALRLCDLQQPD